MMGTIKARTRGIFSLTASRNTRGSLRSARGLLAPDASLLGASLWSYGRQPVAQLLFVHSARAEAKSVDMTSGPRNNTFLSNKLHNQVFGSRNAKQSNVRLLENTPTIRKQNKFQAERVVLRCDQAPLWTAKTEGANQ
jgi:hypothetical protein